jgi:hypothetical protein
LKIGSVRNRIGNYLGLASVRPPKREQNMRKLALTLAAALAAAMTAAPAAAVTVTFDAGATTPVNNAVVFQNFDQYAAGSSIGLNANVYNSDVTNNGKTPNGSTGNYAAVLGGGSYSINLPAFAPVLSFLTGTIDAYNSVTLSLIDTTTGYFSDQTFFGAALGLLNQDGRVTFDTGSSTLLINAVSFRSGQNSFEVDNIASAAPEPGTWAMMILGFGFVGFALRSRRRGKLALA